MQEQNTPAKSHRLRNGILIFAGLILFGMIINAFGKDNQAPQTQSTPQNGSQAATEAAVPAVEPKWVPVKSWKGNGGKKTEPFTITGKQWRINWSNKDTTGYGGTILQVYVYEPGKDIPVDVPINSQGGQDTSYIYKSGEFYLQINGANGNWDISVEELK